MKPLLLTVGNIYIDHNVFGVNGGDEFRLELGKNYFADSGERVLGGSAVNAAMQAHRLGIKVGFVGKTGTDSGAEEVRELLNSQGIISDLVGEDGEQATSMVVNLIDKKGEFIGIQYGGASRALAVEDVDIDHELFKRCNAVYFGGTAKQPILFDKCSELFRTLAERGVKVFYDPNRFPVQEALTDMALVQEQLAFVEGYFPNEDELLQATGKADVDAAIDQVLGSGVKFVAVKLGAKGCRIKTKDDDFTVDGKSVPVVSTVGAGDCFNATFMAYYLKGRSLKECAEKATIAAAIKVSQNIWADQASIEEMEMI